MITDPAKLGGVTGVIEAPFGKVGKVKLRFRSAVFTDPSAPATSEPPAFPGPVSVLLSYKKYPLRPFPKFAQ